MQRVVRLEQSTAVTRGLESYRINDIWADFGGASESKYDLL